MTVGAGSPRSRSGGSSTRSTSTRPSTPSGPDLGRGPGCLAAGDGDRCRSGRAPVFSATPACPTVWASTPSTGTISGTATTTGSFSVVVSVDDQHGGVVLRSFVWEIVGNTAPVDRPDCGSGLRRGRHGLARGERVRRRRRHPRHAATGLPDGIDINATTGQIFGDITQTAATGSPYTVEVTADDQNGGTATTTFTWTVDGVNLDPVDRSGRRPDRAGGRRRHGGDRGHRSGWRHAALHCLRSARRGGHRRRQRRDQRHARRRRCRRITIRGRSDGRRRGRWHRIDDLHLDGRVDSSSGVGRPGGVVRVW